MNHIRLITKETPAYARFYPSPFMGLAQAFMSVLLKLAGEAMADKDLPTG